MKSHLLMAAALVAASAATPIESLAQERTMQTMTMRAHPLPIEGTLPSLAGATTWLNSQPLTPEALRGKVVVVDFWTYTCIDRSLPSLRPRRARRALAQTARFAEPDGSGNRDCIARGTPASSFLGCEEAAGAAA
jgi:hypothetical protein